MAEGARAGTPIGLGLGSNIGDKPDNIKTALERIEALSICRITAVSSLYRTAPWGPVAQESFANACAVGSTGLAPEDLLAAVKRLETEMGRETSVRWGPRLIDIDILFYGDRPLATPDLVLPHKELFNRAFVLVPLAEIAPGLRIAGRSVAEAAAELDRGDVERWPGITWPGTSWPGERG